MVIREAQRDDVPLLLEMFAELADYEHLSASFRATEERLEQALFSERAVAEALIAEREGEAAGYAVYFPTFSSFLASSALDPSIRRSPTKARMIAIFTCTARGL